jgi:hypothetical protein
MKMKINMILMIVAVVIGVLHAVAQFLLWANMGGTNFSVVASSHSAWSVVSFPLFAVLPRDLATRFFWIVFGINSLFWAGCFFVLGKAIGPKLSWWPHS